MMKSLVLLMSVVLIGISSAAPYDGYRKEAMLKNAISKLAEKIEEAKQQRYEQMEEAMDEEYPDYRLEEAKEQEDNKEMDQADKAIAFMNSVIGKPGKLDEELKLKDKEDARPVCWCFEAPCPWAECQDLPPSLSGICVPVSCYVG